MHDWRDFIIRHFTSFEVLDELAIAGALLGLAMFVLPRAERRHLKFPITLLALYVAFIISHRIFFGPISPRSTAAILSLLLLLIALTRLAFLVVVDWLLVRWLRRNVPQIFRDILQGIVFLGGTLILFRSLGAELGSLLTTSAILTAVVGLSLQESLGNLVAGLAVRAEHPFEVGDWIEMTEGQKIVGRVIEINWRATKLQSNDLYEIVVPNGLIAKSTFRNYGRPEPTTRRVVDFQGPYEIAPNQIRDAVIQSLRGCPGLLATPAPRLWVAGFGESGINYQIVYFLSDFGSRQDIDSNIRTRVWYALKRAAVSMPYPVRDLRLRRVPAVSAQDAAEFDTDARVAILNETALFVGMPEAECRALAESAESVLYCAGETLLFEGDAGDDLYIVAQGEVVALTQTPGGETIELARIGVGHLFGELSLITGVRGATITAAQDSVVLRISHASFRRITSNVEGLAEALLSRLLERQAKLSRPEELGINPSLDNGLVRTALLDKIRQFFSP